MAVTHKIELYINGEFIFRGDFDQISTPPQYISILTSQYINNGNVIINEISANHNIYNDWSPVLTVGTEVDRGILSARYFVPSIIDTYTSQVVLSSGTTNIDLDSSNDQIDLDSKALNVGLDSSNKETGIDDIILPGEV